MVNTQLRLLITGTPLQVRSFLASSCLLNGADSHYLNIRLEIIQNNLRELWALLNFLMPDVFGDAEQFDEWFSLTDETGKDNVIKKLHTVLRPFMLRRVKKDAAASIPPKKETKLFIGLTELQQRWYVTCLQKDAHELNKLGGPDKFRLLNVLMQLRKGKIAGPPPCDNIVIRTNDFQLSKLIHHANDVLQCFLNSRLQCVIIHTCSTERKRVLRTLTGLIYGRIVVRCSCFISCCRSCKQKVRRCSSFHK